MEHTEALDDRIARQADGDLRDDRRLPGLGRGDREGRRRPWAGRVFPQSQVAPQGRLLLCEVAAEDGLKAARVSLGKERRHGRAGVRASRRLEKALEPLPANAPRDARQLGPDRARVRR